VPPPEKSPDAASRILVGVPARFGSRQPEKSPAAASRILVGAPARFGSRQPEKWRRRR